MTSARLLPFIDELVSRAGKGMDLGLDRVKQSLVLLGNPQEKCAFVHVTGTNGKGSTSAMVESVARAAGLRTGLYTSPHLCRWAERIRVSGEPLDDDALASALEQVLTAGPEGLTFFEVMTLAAFVAFAEAGIELGVLEVGIGGRFDATNVLEAPLATAITSVALDHTGMLGETLAEIAREKAGIFRKGVPVVLGPLGDEALGAAWEVAEEIGAGPIWRIARPGEILTSGIFPARMQDDGRARIDLPGRSVCAKLSLAGGHQLANAAVAAALVVAASARLPALAKGLESGLSAARWPGRLERAVIDGKEVLLDCAHNPHGVEALAAYLRAEGISKERVVLLFGALGDKAWQEMLAILGPLADRRVYASPKGRAPAPITEMAAQFVGEMVPEGRKAVRRAMEMAGEGDLVVVAGSIYLVGEVRSEILGLATDPVIAL